MKYVLRPSGPMLGLAALLMSTVCFAEPDLVVIVRHAERAAHPASDPGLTHAGMHRAVMLAKALAAANVDSIITTQHRRTQDTAAPLAMATNVQPMVIHRKPGDARAHAEDVAEAVRKQSGNVLVVGHSDTVSLIIAAMGGPSLPKPCETTFHHVYVLRPNTPKTTFVQLTYGDQSHARKERCQ